MDIEDEPLVEDIPSKGVKTKAALKGQPDSTKEEPKGDDEEGKGEEEEDEGEGEDEVDEEKEEDHPKKRKSKPKLSFAEEVAQARYKKFELDTLEANYVRGALLGLGDGVVLTQAQIDASPLFKEKPSDKNVTPDDITGYLKPLIGDGLYLNEEAPHLVAP